MKYNNLKILQVRISKVDYYDLLSLLEYSFKGKNQIILTYANVNTINLAVNNLRFREAISEFNILHPDGIGVFLASRFLYGKNGFAKRITGSDFYNGLIMKSIENNWSLFFFGDTDETLKRIPQKHPDLRIAGSCNGFNFNLDDLISQISNSKPDILIVGLGSPKQEQWIIENKNKIQTKVIIAVGEGIKVFAGTKKRGLKFFQIIGLEWLVRLVNEPRRLWKRYLIGVPIFIFKIIFYKLKFNKSI